MEWGRLYANLPNDPRVQAAEDRDGAAWLLVESMCYCTSAETGGFIPHTQVDRFGGGAKKKQKVAALVRERLWVPVEGGYMLDPMIWSEERNLSDQAERKREADRRRIAAKRAAERAGQNGHVPTGVSRDSSATSRATSDATAGATEDAMCSGDSRALEKRREEKTKADVVNHPTVRNAQRQNDDDDELVAAVVGAVLERTERLLSDDEARIVAAKILTRAEATGSPVLHPARYVAAAIAREPDLFGSLLLDEPPPLGEILTAWATPPPALCGQCDPRTRMREDPATGQPHRCPDCHPSAVEAS